VDSVGDSVAESGQPSGPPAIRWGWQHPVVLVGWGGFVPFHTPAHVAELRNCRPLNFRQYFEH
jgi:hypothetical protein